MVSQNIKNHVKEVRFHSNIRL